MSASDWTVDKVAAWVEAHNHAEVAAAFRENEVDGEALLLLDSGMLKELGVLKIGPRAKLLKAIQNLSSEDSARVASTPRKSQSSGKKVRRNPDGTRETSEQRLARIKVEQAARAKTVSTGVLYSGFLTKEGGKLKTWRRRYFVLQDFVLSYYKTEKAWKLNRKDPKKSRPLGRIPIPSYEVDFCTKRTNCFQVSHDGCRTYFFQADNRESMLGWMKFIRQQGLATASADWFESEAVFYNVKRCPDDALSVEMTMDKPEQTPSIKPNTVYRYQCRLRVGETFVPIALDVGDTCITVMSEDRSTLRSKHVYTVIQRYMVDASDPIFTFKEVVGTTEKNYSFHMGNHAIARHVNDVMTGHIAVLTRLVLQRKADEAGNTTGDVQEEAQALMKSAKISGVVYENDLDALSSDTEFFDEDSNEDDEEDVDTF